MESLEFLKHISVNTHSSVRFEWEGKVAYVDPFGIPAQRGDADLIFLTHSHFDHFSEQDVEKVWRPDTVFVAPAEMEAKVREFAACRRVIPVEPGCAGSACGIPFEAVPAYNVGKRFHPRENRWVGYILTFGGVRVYVAGDTDATEDAAAVRCHIAMLPIGGTYTMDPRQAAELANRICPDILIPIHYGSVVGDASCVEQLMEHLDPGIGVCHKVGC
jgi:L-ascorbate metabolism protein UlaG (beta-lactamase superfamily)